MEIWILLAIVAVLVFWAIGLYNRLVGLRNQVLNGWRQIDVQLKRRHDLIPNLVNTVRGAMEFERDTLTQVMEARARAVSATGPADAARKEGELTLMLRPEQLHLGAIQGENQLTGKVDNVAFLGSIIRILVRVGDSILTLDVLNERGNVLPKMGDTTIVSFPADGSWVLPSS